MQVGDILWEYRGPRCRLSGLPDEMTTMPHRELRRPRLSTEKGAHGASRSLAAHGSPAPRVAAALLLLLLVPASAANLARRHSSKDAPKDRQIVIACNGFAHRGDAIVGERPLAGSSKNKTLSVGLHTPATGRPDIRRLQQPPQPQAYLDGPPRRNMRGSAEYSNGGASLLSTGSQETMLPSKEVADHVKKEIRRHSSHRHAVSTAVIDPDDNDFSSHSGHHHLAARSGVAKAALANAFWTRPLAYGECMKLHVDFHDRQLFFVTPHKADVCKLSRSRVLELSEPEVDPEDEDVLEDDVAEGTEAAPDEPTRAAVVLTQLKADDSRCSLQSQTLTRKRSRYGAAAAELALLDAFTQPKLEDRKSVV